MKTIALVSLTTACLLSYPCAVLAVDDVVVLSASRSGRLSAEAWDYVDQGSEQEVTWEHAGAGPVSEERAAWAGGSTIAYAEVELRLLSQLDATGVTLEGLFSFLAEGDEGPRWGYGLAIGTLDLEYEFRTDAPVSYGLAVEVHGNSAVSLLQLDTEGVWQPLFDERSHSLLQVSRSEVLEEGTYRLVHWIDERESYYRSANAFAFDLAFSAPTPVQSTSWGGIKSHYRAGL